MNWRAISAYCHTALSHSVAKIISDGIPSYEAYRLVPNRCAIFLGGFPDSVSAKKACLRDLA